jgi:hypothetical protein
MAMFHDNKFQRAHDEFFAAAKKIFPMIETRCMIVTDEEGSITAAIEKELPNIPAFLCWRHVLAAIENWITNHNGKPLDKAIYKNDFMKLIKLRTRSEYDSELKLIKDNNLWDPAFLEYIENCVGKRIDKIGRWALDEYNLYNERGDGGITTNISEG